MSESLLRREWWESLQHNGLILGPREAQKLAADYPPEALSDFTVDRLRREVSRLDAKETDPAEFSYWVLRNMFGFHSEMGNRWFRGTEVPGEFSHVLITGETLKPRMIWRGAQGGLLPVFVDKNPNVLTVALANAHKFVPERVTNFGVWQAMQPIS